MGKVISIKGAASDTRGEIEEEEAAPESGEWEGLLLYGEGKNPRIENCIKNAILILTHDPIWKGVLAWDEFSQAIVFTRPPQWDAEDAPKTPPRFLDDYAVTSINSWLNGHYRLKLSEESVYKAALTVARAHAVDTASDWIRGMTWDAVPRVETWLTDYLGAQDSTYTRLCGRFFLVSAMARVFRPGSQVDTMLILEGPQGGGKTSALAALFGDFFADTPLDLTSKDRFTNLRGYICIAFDELSALNKAENSAVKTFLTSRKDNYRPPFGRLNVEILRRCIFAGTVNRGGSGYLKDPTGARRFNPVAVGIVDIPRLTADREQLLAEAYALYLAGVQWWPTLEETVLFQEEQADRADVDVWDTKIQAYISGREDITIGEVLSVALCIESGKQDQRMANRAADCLHRAGWERRRPMVNGSRVYKYFPPASSTASSGAPEEALEGSGGSSA